MSADSPSNACPARLPARSMDVDDAGAMVHKWEFGDPAKAKTLRFRMDKCIGCDLCRIVCPTSCIELGPVPEIASGKLEGVPPILVNHETCAYCGLCAAVCPTGAFEFSTAPADFITIEELPRFHFKPFVEHVQRHMKRSFDHPASSEVKAPPSLKKPSEGKVLLRGDLLGKCDPMGCKGCLQICPTGCFWVPKKAEDIAALGKITVDDDLCIHCGACRNACPHRIIEVTRTRVEHELPGGGKMPWHAAWEKRIGLLLEHAGQVKLRPKLQVAETAQEQPPAAAPAVRLIEIPREVKEQLLRDYEAVKESLAQVNTRYWIEFTKIEPLRKAISKILPSKKGTRRSGTGQPE
ncbi:MAG: 4Fe-4S binding protein [Candidatus Lokiarchaeota archaeon]|nr:4Fe-4S binding protein [Candidatus Lokiarchaeota archaeon]